MKVEELLGLVPSPPPALEPPSRTNSGGAAGVLSESPSCDTMRFSVLFFSDVRSDVTATTKYSFMRDLAVFADNAGFEALYLPERHFHEFGAIFANPAIVAAHLIPQTKRVRFRTAGVSLPLHHPTEVVEWWATNDVLSQGRVDLGFGSGWARSDFILKPDAYETRRRICSETIGLVQRLWRGETLDFQGPDGESFPVRVFPRPVQKELQVWLLVTQSDDGFLHAGRQGYNVFTMLYGNNLEIMQRKIALYRQGRKEAGLDPATGTVTLTLHTLLLDERPRVEAAVREPFRAYIKSSLEAHLKAAAADRGEAPPGEDEKARILDYAYERYFRTGAMFGTLDDARRVVKEAKQAGVDEIACLLDFGVDYDIVRASLPSLAELVTSFSSV